MYCKDQGRYRKLPSVVPLYNHHNINEEAPLESPEQSSSSSSPSTSSICEKEFDTVVSLNDSPFPNSVLTCASPNLSPISTLTTEGNLDVMPELAFDPSIDFLSDFTRDDHSGTLLPGIQYQSYNEIYTITLDDGTFSTFHRTLYIPIRVEPVARGNFTRGLLPHSGPLDFVSPQLPAYDMDRDQNTGWSGSTNNSVHDNESFPNPERENQPKVDECNLLKGDNHTEEDGRAENNQLYCASLEYTLDEFERTMTTFSFDSESSDNPSSGISITP